jgi:hypothetical protein
MSNDPEIDIEWGEEIPPDVESPDLQRTQWIWVSVDRARIGGAFVSTTGFAAIVQRLDEPAWQQLVSELVAKTITRNDPSLAFSQSPSRDHHYVYQAEGQWSHRPLTQQT